MVRVANVFKGPRYAKAPVSTLESLPGCPRLAARRPAAADPRRGSIPVQPDRGGEMEGPPPMPVRISPGSQTPEREAAQTLADLLAPGFGRAGDVVLVPNAMCWGESCIEMDLLLFARLDQGYNFSGVIQDEGTGRHTIRLANLALVIEIKDHPPEAVRFEGTSVRVRYKDEWFDVSRQTWKQQESARCFLQRSGRTPPWFGTLIWLRNVPRGAIPLRAVNVLPANPSIEDFHRAVMHVRPPVKSEDPHRPWSISFAREGDMDAILGASDLFTQTVQPATLDRRKLEKVCERLTRDQEYARHLGQQLLIFRGRGGSGKTMNLLRIAHELYSQQAKRVLLLTYNKALVADLRRLLALCGIGDSLDSGQIRIATAHSYFCEVLGSWGLWDDKPTDNWEEPYEARKKDLLDLLKSESPEDLRDEKEVRENPETYAWDHVLVDEGQDWPRDERDILYRLFGPDKCIVADGVDQLVRDGVHCDWRDPGIVRDRYQIVHLRRSLRLKSNLCRFLRAFADAVDCEFDMEVNESLPGGRVLIFERDYYRSLHEQVMDRHLRSGNEPIDALFCVPPAHGVATPLPGLLRDWGLQVWDGTEANIRDTFPMDTRQHRVVKYDSSRGLEGWSVVCLGIDDFYSNKRKYWKPQGQLTLESNESAASRAAYRWCLIPLSRAIDTLVIQARQDGPVGGILRAISSRLPDFVEWQG